MPFRPPVASCALVPRVAASGARGKKSINIIDAVDIDIDVDI